MLDSKTRKEPNRSSRPVFRTSVGFFAGLISASAYFALAILSRLFPNEFIRLAFGLTSTLIQTFLDLTIVYYALKIDEELFHTERNRRIFVFGFLCAAVGDLLYGFTVNVFGIVGTHGTWIELAFNLPFNLFLSTMGYLMTRLVLQGLSDRRKRIAIFLFCGFLALALFYFAGEIAPSVGPQTFVLTGWSLVFEPAILAGSAVFFLFGITLPSQLLGGGLWIICSVNLFLQYLEFSGRLVPAVPYEAFWVVGQLSVLSGIAYAYKNPSAARTSIDFRFGNIRARFIVSLFALMSILHLCWHLFFVSFGPEKNLPGQIFLTLIFFSLALLPLTLLFKALFISPVLRILQRLYRSQQDASYVPFMDPDLKAGMIAVLDRLLDSERARMQSKASAQMATQVAHDIRAPLQALNSVLGSGEMERVSASARETLAASIYRIREIANTLLETNKGTVRVYSERVLANENRCPQNLYELLSVLVQEKKIELPADCRIDIASQFFGRSDRILGLVDPKLFNRVFSNLINNGVDALGNAGGTVQVSLASESEHALITVSDNGCGIPVEIQSQLGKHGFTYGKKGGYGLGLFHAFWTIESWGGSLTIDSEVDRGTVVTVRLPILRGSPVVSI